MSCVLAVDLGKTRCRAALSTDTTVHWRGSGDGAPGLADGPGSDDALTAVLASAPQHVLAEVTAVGIGVAGAAAHPAAAQHWARDLANRMQIPVMITSDLVTAHAGALGGQGGVVLIAGTGAVACRIDDDDPVPSGLRRADGWGPWLGDEGSGRWLGQQGLAAALRHHDGRGPETTLLAAMIDSIGRPDALPAHVGTAANPAGRLAAFAPTVLDHAATGDEVATTIVQTGVQRLTETVTVLAAPGEAIAVVGGLTAHPYFRVCFDRSATAAGLQVRDPITDAIGGAALLAVDRHRPQESYVQRA